MTLVILSWALLGLGLAMRHYRLRHVERQRLAERADWALTPRPLRRPQHGRL
jgi:hypothetical protein